MHSQTVGGFLAIITLTGPGGISRTYRTQNPITNTFSGITSNGVPLNTFTYWNIGQNDDWGDLSVWEQWYDRNDTCIPPNSGAQWVWNGPNILSNTMVFQFQIPAEDLEEVCGITCGNNTLSPTPQTTSAPSTHEPTTDPPTPDIHTKSPTPFEPPPSPTRPTRAPNYTPPPSESPISTIATPAPTCGECELHFCGHGDDQIWLDVTDCTESGDWTNVCSELTHWNIPINCTYCSDVSCGQTFRVTVQETAYVIFQILSSRHFFDRLVNFKYFYNL